MFINPRETWQVRKPRHGHLFELIRQQNLFAADTPGDTAEAQSAMISFRDMACASLRA